MSFLLRNNRRNKDSNPVGAARRPAFGSDRRIIPEPRNTSLLRHKNVQNSHTQATFDYGHQVQVQRTVQRAPSVATKHHATVTKQKQQHDSGVITMSEVLEDLRVLEMQQRESQRKLTSARITKDNRLQQQAALEVQLERNKYTNGELRAQIRQFRDFLSCGTRELGTRRLAGSRAGDDIKAFEQQLKRGLQAQRTNTSLVRKISSLIIGLQNKEAILQRLNAESKEKFALLEKDCLDAKHTEESLRKSIQNEVSKAHKVANEVAQIRGKSTALEEELLSAQSSEESTRLRVQAMDAELESENKRHVGAMDELQAQLKKYEQDMLSFKTEEKKCTGEIEQLSKDLLKKKEQVVAIQEKEGHAPSSYTNDFKEAVPVLDKKKFSAILEVTKSSVSAKRSENEELRAKLDGIRASIQQSKQDAEKNSNETKSLMDSTISEKATQKSRSEEISSFQARLEKERLEVVELRKSCLDLQEEQGKESIQNTSRIAEIDGNIKKEQDIVESLSKQIAEIEQKDKVLEESFQTESSDLNGCIKAKKESIQALETEIARTEDEEKAGYEEFDKRYKEELKQIENEREAYVDHVRAEKNKLFEQYPSLEEIVYEYDDSKSLEDQAQEALHALTDEMQTKVDAAERAREAREEEKREAIRKAAEAEAAVRKKEELRRENRKKRLAELQHEEAEERSRKKNSIDAQLADFEESHDVAADSKQWSGLSHSSKKQSSKKKRHSDFYDPLDETVLSETETSPAEPKLLFPKYEAYEYSPPHSATSGTQNSEKRVHWKDQNRLSDSPADASEKSRSNKSHTSRSHRQTRKYGSSFESRNTSKKVFSTRSSRSSEPVLSRTSTKLDDFDDLLNSESVEYVPSKHSTSTKKTSNSRTFRSSKSSSSRIVSKLDHFEDLLNSESNEEESKDYESDEIDEFVPKNDTVGTSDQYPSDESSGGVSRNLKSKPVDEKKTYRRRSSKREETSHFDSLMAVPDTSSRHDHSSAKNRRKRKKASTDSKYLGDSTTADVDVDERPKKKLKEGRSSYHNDMCADAGIGGRSKSRTKKYGTIRSKDEISKKSTRDRKSGRDSRTKSSPYHVGDEDSYKSRSKDKKEDNGEKVSNRGRSVDKSSSALSSTQPKDKNTVKSQSSKGSRGSSKSRVSSSITVGSKGSKEMSTSSLTSGSRSRKKVPTGSKKIDVSKKRKLSATSASQVSDATGRTQKARRRKKKDTAVSNKASSKSLAPEGSYDFHF